MISLVLATGCKPEKISFGSTLKKACDIKDAYEAGIPHFVFDAKEELHKIANFRTNEIDMYALEAIYNKSNNTIELFNKVKVIRGGETIIGDYAIVNTLDKSYKVNSETSKKVKILIDSSENIVDE